MIEVRNVWKEYGEQVVLERLDLKVEKGEFCSMVGASGCGKSTFLRLLLGQERVTRGEILLDGKALPGEPDAERGVVFQRYSVFDHLTVMRNVLLGLELPQARWTGRLFGQRRRSAEDEAVAMLEKVGLGSSLDKYPHQLSGGMQQRLAIAQALIMKPRVLLLDEPFGALDPGIRKDMHELLLNLWRESGLTIFMVTHDLKEGFALGSRVLVFDKVRVDPQAPNAYGARITYNIPLDHSRDCPPALRMAQAAVEGASRAAAVAA
ncbi:ABC transporter ATP-binding protein [Paraburkholderia phenoliruptrix]|uniref:Bicarbonate transport ATP-binding protein CmpD n=2 Tax=Paraburkholderia phenoliruptrix TaxID=252970 RepID=A0A6J5A566_9BURK|nr:ABC transporter ATP-binding protein [Paraburkholderia phenoliruptrix]AFT88537.1 sulfonate/nitrate/taurine transport system ATP-binding protein [Paraburkholderia phenoliruptrix BR3459a]MDR6391536.1 NitT/TauT family transport system ATP-binding protein [Paraburkholderia phenoliruptrix]MDR6418801.1 NitT/TauT family transport system ATP-binding protein [Paraburkholderia phenoliruptrix]WMY11647.1 ABC transporter ATP-binding protein [Paraburkholderia phenoliruptrix]CAB3645840.1 Bicarbonate transp